MRAVRRGKQVVKCDAKPFKGTGGSEGERSGNDN